jgi:hypothetical protein
MLLGHLYYNYVNYDNIRSTTKAQHQGVNYTRTTEQYN